MDETLEAEEKRDWLYAYIQTYLQRDVRDLANLRELEPFVRAQKTLAGLTGQTLNMNNLAKLAGISPKTAKRFITYLEISYQIILLNPWFRNTGKRLSKSPKAHYALILSNDHRIRRIDDGIMALPVGWFLA